MQIKLTLTLLCALTAFGAEKAPAVSQAHLDKMVRHWQHILKLDDWECSAEFVKLSDLPEGTMGASLSSKEGRVVLIQVLDPKEYANAAAQNDIERKHGKEITRDIEDTVIHELLHLRLHELVQADADSLKATEEMTVDRLTSAFLATEHHR